MSRSPVDEELSGDVVVNHDKEGADDKIQRIRKEGDSFFQRKEIIKEILCPDADEEPDDRQNQEGSHPFHTLSGICLCRAVDHEGGHQIIDDHPDDEATGGGNASDIPGRVTTEEDKLKQITGQEIKDPGDESDKSEAEDFPEQLVRMRLPFRFKMIDEEIIETDRKCSNQHTILSFKVKTISEKSDDNEG